MATQAEILDCVNELSGASKEAARLDSEMRAVSDKLHELEVLYSAACQKVRDLKCKLFEHVTGATVVDGVVKPRGREFI